MIGALALLTGWALLSPLLVLVFASVTHSYASWMRPFIDIAASVPLLGFMTIGGIVMMVIGARQLGRQREKLGPY